MSAPTATECLPQERQHAIVELLTTQGRVVASDLARQFNTSEDTIRRDLRELAAARDYCQRVYGGALPVSPASGSLAERKTQHPERKQALAECLIQFITPEQVVFIDAGSTNLAIAQALPAELKLTVVTNAPAIAAVLAERKTFILFCLAEPSTGILARHSALRPCVMSLIFALISTFWACVRWMLKWG